ncbi:MAG TPA: alpha/beta hydrolase [Pseudolabrys sp.]|nr:alpha/beta hydrolase [Pseudolabrys sp.]
MASVIERTKDTLRGFERREIDVGGISTVVYVAGEGSPLVYLHGSGTFPGFSFAQKWTKNHQVFIPYHPGFGESGDDHRIESMQDYVLHYLDLFDALGIGRLSLIGSSFGGWMAAEIALTQQNRLDRLVLVAPSGLVVKNPPSTDLFTVPPSELPDYLVTDRAVLAPYMPTEPDVDFMVLRYREVSATARLTWENPSGNRKLEQWAHRIKTPTLLLWGEHDRIRPAAHGALWKKLLPNAKLEILRDAGHLVLEEQPAAADVVTHFLATA